MPDSNSELIDEDKQEANFRIHTHQTTKEVANIFTLYY